MSLHYYAIREKATLRYISGTDFSRADGRCHQIFASLSRPPLLLSGAQLQYELERRRINLERFEVVVVEVRKAEPI